MDNKKEEVRLIKSIETLTAKELSMQAKLKASEKEVKDVGVLIGQKDNLIADKQNEFNTFVAKIDANREVLEKEIEELKEVIKGMNERQAELLLEFEKPIEDKKREISLLEANKENLEISIEAKTLNEALLIKSNENLIKENEGVKKDIDTNNNELTSILLKIEEQKTLLLQAEDDTKEATKAKNTADKDRETAEKASVKASKELKELVGKKFAIARREQHAKDQEVHIKEMFKLAGEQYLDFDEANQV